MSTCSEKRATDGADANLKQEFCKLRDSVKYCRDTCYEMKRTNKDVQAMTKKIKELTGSNRSKKEGNHRFTQRVKKLEE